MRLLRLFVLLCFFCLPSPALPAPAAAAAAAAAAAVKTTSVSILFFETETKLPLGMDADLAPLLKQYRRDKEKRFIITSYAALSAKPSWAAFRLSLQRALTLRDYFEAHNVLPKHIILLPKGNVCSSPCQRADIELK